MEAAHRGKPLSEFQAPPGVTEVWIDADTGYRAGAECEHVMREAFISKTEPREVCPALHLPAWPDTAMPDSALTPIDAPEEVPERVEEQPAGSEPETPPPAGQ